MFVFLLGFIQIICASSTNEFLEPHMAEVVSKQTKTKKHKHKKNKHNHKHIKHKHKQNINKTNKNKT